MKTSDPHCDWLLSNGSSVHWLSQKLADTLTAWKAPKHTRATVKGRSLAALMYVQYTRHDTYHTTHIQTEDSGLPITRPASANQNVTNKTSCDKPEGWDLCLPHKLQHSSRAKDLWIPNKIFKISDRARSLMTTVVSCSQLRQITIIWMLESGIITHTRPPHPRPQTPVPTCPDPSFSRWCAFLQTVSSPVSCPPASPLWMQWI